MADKSLDNIILHKDLLKILAFSKTRYKKAILNKADKQLILSICDIIFNILNGNVHIDNDTKNKLNKHKFFLRRLIEKSSLQQKKKILIQKGGNILGIILPALITTLSAIFAK
jgi:hypothetical protein